MGDRRPNQRTSKTCPSHSVCIEKKIEDAIREVKTYIRGLIKISRYGVIFNEQYNRDTAFALSSVPRALPLRLVVALQRYTRKESRYALLLLHPVVHQLWQILWPSFALRDQLHSRPISIRARFAQRLKDKRRRQVVYRCHSHLSVRVKGKLESEDGRDRLSELGALSRKDLQIARLNGSE
jgi:hypothetical protein